MTIPYLFTNPIILEKGSEQKILWCLLQVLDVHNGQLLTSFKEDSSFFFLLHYKSGINLDFLLEIMLSENTE